jgi:hypothetical protein
MCRVDCADATEMHFGCQLVDRVAGYDCDDGPFVDRPTRRDPAQHRLDSYHQLRELLPRLAIVWKADKRQVVFTEFTHTL